MRKDNQLILTVTNQMLEGSDQDLTVAIIKQKKKIQKYSLETNEIEAMNK